MAHHNSTKKGKVTATIAAYFLTLGCRLLRDSLFCDYTIRSNEKFDFKVHKAELYTHSRYFRNILLNSELKENKKRLVILDYPACLLARMILYCYKREDYSLMSLGCFANRGNWQDDYSDAKTNNFTAAKLAIKMWEIGDWAFMPGLKQRARQLFLKSWTNKKKTQHDNLEPKEAAFNRRDFAGGEEIFTEIV